MDATNRLRNNLIRRIQYLSTDKLTEIDLFLNQLEHKIKSKEKTLKLAGTWRELSDDIFVDLTYNLHNKRSDDRKII